jgi:hypothetical protein
MTFADDWAAARRAQILRFLARLGGEANETVIAVTLEHTGFARDSRDTFRADLDHLRTHGCVTEEWFDEIRVVRLTERGDMAAQGRVTVPGVECSRWKAP